MPIVEFKAFEHRFTDQAKVDRLIAGLTEAVVDVYGEDLRNEIEVIVEGVDPKRWGFGGKVRG
jgi:4-oxalocrotonate tautomerase family enzyme